MVSPAEISGANAAEIADSIRSKIDSGRFRPGSVLPSIRNLAEARGVNRNTIAAVYAQLATAGIVESRRRGGTVVLGAPFLDGEGTGPTGDLINLAGGNPDPQLLPSLAGTLDDGFVPPLYGAPPIADELLGWIETNMSPSVGPREHGMVITHGAVDAVERLLNAYLTRGDLVAVEDPCFLSSIGTLRLNGYRSAAVPVDDQGLTPQGLAAALHSGARAVICTPRAHNPTGASVSAARAQQLRSVLERFPDVLVIEDDHFSAVSTQPYNRITPETSQRWALVRSVSKFLGPNLRVAFVLADPETANRVATRLGSTTTWVSHILQHIVVAILRRPGTRRSLTRARDQYAVRSRRFLTELRDRGISVADDSDGLNVWIPIRAREKPVVNALAERGWAVRPGSSFAVSGRSTRGLRVTTSTMTAAQAALLADDLADILQPMTGLGR